MLYWFFIWREFKLSIAEIFSVFNNILVIYSAKNLIIIDWLNQEEILNKAWNLWGVIKIFELKLFTEFDHILKIITNTWKWHSSKFNYSINLFPENSKKLSKILLNTKRNLKAQNISSRFVNKTDKNLSSAQILWNSLLKKWADLNIVDLDEIYYFWKTIWVQDIDSYSARDYWKQTDMDIWMLPPKLSQIMINISRDSFKEISSLYDPFVGLWTILIEGAYMWINNLYGSDFNKEMIQKSKSNLWNIKSKFPLINVNILLADARDINQSEFLKNNDICNIVTEWFLWEIMTKKNMCLDRINIQRKNLKKLYEKFFSWLKEVWFKGVIVISFPFWELSWKYIYFEEIYGILKKYCKILSLFPIEFDFKETKSGSLLYKRQKQLVWREIFKLKIK